jgi:hypothetical protein
MSGMMPLLFLFMIYFEHYVEVADKKSTHHFNRAMPTELF